MKLFRKFLSLFQKKVEINDSLKAALIEYKHVTRLLCGQEASEQLTNNITEISLLSTKAKVSGEALTSIQMEITRYKALNEIELLDCNRRMALVLEGLESRFGSGSALYKKASEKMSEMRQSHSSHDVKVGLRDLITELQDLVAK